MANVLSDEKAQQVLALGRLGWSLGKIEAATGIRCSTRIFTNGRQGPSPWWNRATSVLSSACATRRRCARAWRRFASGIPPRDGASTVSADARRQRQLRRLLSCFVPPTWWL